jgi:hypothetical protein
LTFEEFARKRLLRVADKVGTKKLGNLEVIGYEQQLKAVNTSINIFRFLFFFGESMALSWFFIVYIPKTKGLGYEPAIASMLLMILLLLLFSKFNKSKTL